MPCEIRAKNQVVSGFRRSLCNRTLTAMSTVVGYIFALAVGLSLLAILLYVVAFFSAIIVGLFGKKHDPLTEELDQFLDDLLGPEASPWHEPERMHHGKRHR